MFNSRLNSFLTSIVIFCIGHIHGANILAFFPSLGRSHSKPIHPLLEKLALRGHNITLFSYYPYEENASTNIHNVIIQSKISFVDNDGFGNFRSYSKIYNWIFFHDEIIQFSLKLIRTKEFNNLVDTNTKYDLIFLELYHTDGFLALSQLYNCPIIGVSFQPPIQIYNWIFGKTLSSSYIPHGYLPYSDVMSFWQRTMNFLFDVFTVLFYNWKSISAHQEVINLILKNRVAHPGNLQDLTDNVSVILKESHFSSAYVKPELPNMIDVAGFHIEKNKSLPNDIQTFMDSAENGVIVVSLGSLIEPSLAGELGIRLFKIFQTCSYKVIWKWDKDYFENVPNNILILAWLPQLDILNHPNCKLFISHGGYHSILEGIYSGVPILGLPFFTDQHFNTGILTKLRIGLKVSPEASENELQEVITKLLEDVTYKHRAKFQSVLFKDRPKTAMNTAIYWTEYVLRNNGARHLQTAAQDLFWFQYLLLDVIVFLSFCFFITVYLIVICIRVLHLIIIPHSKNPTKIKGN